MACSCNNSYYSLPCCCPPEPITTTTTTLCPDGTICEEVIQSDCVIYNGFDLSCYGIEQGDSLTSILETLLDLLPGCPVNLNIDVSLELPGASINSFSVSLYSSPVSGTLPVTSGNNLTAVLTLANPGGNLVTNVTTGDDPAILLIIVNNVVIGSANVAANQTNVPVDILGLTWTLSDMLTVQLIAQ
jgi:hypothetical protein